MAWYGGGTTKQEEGDGTGGRRVEGIDPVINMSVVGAAKEPLEAPPKDMKLKKGGTTGFFCAANVMPSDPQPSTFHEGIFLGDVSSMAKWREGEVPPHFLSHLAVSSGVLSRG